MSVWSWKRNAWVNTTLAVALIIAVTIGISSAGIRTKFQQLPETFKFHGGIFPEIGIFNFFLYFSSLLGFISVALRYSYTLDQTPVTTPITKSLNKISISVGILSFLGLLLVASFPDSSEEKDIVQTIGAYLFIGLGMAFTILQTVLTFNMSRCSTTFAIRLCLVFTLMSAFISAIVFIEKHKGENRYLNDTSIQNNETERISNVIKASNSQLIACISEWISVVIYALYFLSFASEFHRISTYIILRPFINTATSDFQSSSMTINERV